MSVSLKDFLAKIEAGWNPPAFEKPEYLRRLREQIQGLLDKALDCAPVEEKELALGVMNASSLEELGPSIERVWEKAEKRHPGICAMACALIKREAVLARDVQ